MKRALPIWGIKFGVREPWRTTSQVFSEAAGAMSVIRSSFPFRTAIHQTPKCLYT
jgi:hypothetical protein